MKTQIVMMLETNYLTPKELASVVNQIEDRAYRMDSIKDCAAGVRSVVLSIEGVEYEGSPETIAALKEALERPANVVYIKQAAE